MYTLEDYLLKIGVERKDLSLDFLKSLMKNHIESIPHENIDGIYNFYSSIEIQHLLKKYIKENRGGMCFELNYSFAWLLYELGFKLELRLAHVWAYNEATENSPYPTHPIILVHLENMVYLCDVGWSDSYRHPIPLNEEIYRDIGGTGNYRVIQNSKDGYVMQKQLDSKTQEYEDGWFNQFEFDAPDTPMITFEYPKGFIAAHVYTRVGPGYLFTDLFKFSKIEDNGHRTIWGNNLLSRKQDIKQRQSITTSADISGILEKEFQVDAKIAKKCVKIERSMSCPSFFKKYEGEIIDSEKEAFQLSKEI